MSNEEKIKKTAKLKKNEAPGDDVEKKEREAATDETDPETLHNLLAEQTTRAEDYYNRLARLQAEYDNFRRRTRQETESFYKYASEQLAGALLPVLDNFERALAAEGDSVESFKSGVDMIYRQLLDVLATEGVKEIPAVGEQFDPVKHEAVLQAESDEYPENTIIEEFRRGYYLKDKVIRPSMVKVAKSSNKSNETNEQEVEQDV